jgi:sugar transferase (PEP-CTERM/EpsH1 system associated)
MKILWVKAGGLVPPDTGGKIRSYNILRQLAKQHELTFFSFYAAHQNDVHYELSKLFHQVVLVPLELPPPRGVGEFLNYAGNLFSREPYNLTKYCRPVVRQKLRALLQTEKFDVILCDFLSTAAAIPWDLPGPKVLFAHNVEAVIWQRHYEVAKNPLWKMVSRWEWKRMQHAERKYLRKADHVIAVSENDRTAFAAYVDPARISVAQTGVDTEFFQPSERESENEIPNSLVFTGSMDWLPNEDAILSFVGEILPLIKRQLPNLSLCVVGRQPSRRLKDLASRTPELQLTGWVQDVRPFISQRAVYIVPLRIGGGTRLKIFEAMSMAKPVVSTSIGAEGLPVTNGEHLLLADDPATFAETTVRLLGDASRRAQLGQAARRLVEENYSWARVSEAFAQVLKNVIGRPG